MLAALAIVLIWAGKKVVYLPDCRRLARSFLTYLKSALVLTYAGDLQTQTQFLQCTTDRSLVDWCIERPTSIEEELYFLIDQMNALDTDSDSLNSVSVNNVRNKSHIWRAATT